jgi:2-haloacid dehalogenase
MLGGIKALTFDTGGTILDWHTGLCQALAQAGAQHGLSADWPAITNEYRRRSLKMMVSAVSPSFNIEDVHRRVLDAVIEEFELTALTADNRASIWRKWHALDAWPDVPPALVRLKTKYVVVSFTILSTSLVIDVSRRNGLGWDCIVSCEMIGAYKTQPQAYRTCAQWLGYQPDQLLMVACHNFDLMAARDEGYLSAFVHRPAEWGPAGPPDPVPNPAHDIVAQDFTDLAAQLGA